MWFFLVLYLQQVAGYSPLKSGLAVLPESVVMFALSSRFGALSDRFGPRLFMGGGPLIAGAGMLMLLSFGVRVDYLTETVDAGSVDELKAYADRYLELLKSGIVTVVAGDKFVIKVSNDLVPQYDATLLKDFFGPRSGGRPQLVSGKLTVGA